jgi:hypothetical protein
MRRSKLLGKVNELRKMPTLRWRGILAMFACTIPLAFLFGYFGAIDIFMPVTGTFIVLFFTLRCHWELKGRLWFWITVGIWIAIHVWTIVRIHWPSGWVPARAWEGCMTVDLVAIFVVIAVIEKVLHEGPFAPKVRQVENETYQQ